METSTNPSEGKYLAQRRGYKKRYYVRDLALPGARENESKDWDDQDREKIMADDRPNDLTLAQKLGRSLNAIQTQRCLMRRIEKERREEEAKKKAAESAT
jgi:hypothetical protein